MMSEFTRNTEAYNTIRQEYEQYTLNAAQVGERVMSYAQWLEKYRGVCPDDIRMLVRKGKNDTN